MDQYRPFRSVMVYISLAQILVFVYYVILAAKNGITIPWGTDGPIYRKVEQMFNLIWCYHQNVFLGATDTKSL